MVSPPLALIVREIVHLLDDLYECVVNAFILDLKSNQPKGLITDWQDDNVEHEQNFINYYSYTKGLRHKDVVDDEKCHSKL